MEWLLFRFSNGIIIIFVLFCVVSDRIETSEIESIQIVASAAAAVMVVLMVGGEAQQVSRAAVVVIIIVCGKKVSIV